MTVDQLIDQLVALRSSDPAIGGMTVVIEQWYAVLSRGPAINAEHAEVVRAYMGGRDVRVVALKSP